MAKEEYQMARDLNQLLKQYGKSAAPEKRGGMPGGRPGGPPGRGPRPTGKPKNTGKTIARMLSYVAKYKFRLVAVDYRDQQLKLFHVRKGVFFFFRFASNRR